MVVETLNLEAQAHRFNTCMVDIFEFSKYATIKDEATTSKIPFQWMPHNKYLIQSLLTYRYVDLLKTKQAWCSWTAALYHCWLTYRPHANVLCLSRGEKEAAVLLDKSRFINSRLPNWLQNRVGQKDGMELMTFPETGAQIMALPSTEDAGVGYTFTHATRDEVEFHKYAETNYGHIRPTIERALSALDMSTPSAAADTHFKSKFRRSLAGETRCKAIFFPYYVVPGRDADWYVKEERDYFPKWMFKRDYPRNLQDALGSIEGEGLFDAAAIDRCVQDMKEPAEVRANGVIIFRKPDPRIKYYAGGDGAEGRGGNNSVIFILGTDGFDKELVAILRSNSMTPDIFSFHAHALLQEYGRPMLVMGSDAWSQMILEALVAQRYRDRIYCSKKDKLGLIEDEANKQTRLMQFAVEVRNGLRIRDKQTINEMAGWILQSSKETGRSKYVSTMQTDDCIIAGANAVLCREVTPKSTEVPVDRYF